mgnify:CR=1 FL=1
MKYLKTFESCETLIPEEEHFNGLTKEFIDDMFIDLYDEGFKISTYLDKRAITSRSDGGKLIIGTFLITLVSSVIKLFL